MVRIAGEHNVLELWQPTEQLAEAVRPGDILVRRLRGPGHLRLPHRGKPVA